MDIKYFSTPILLIVWRRPKETLEVIDSLRKIKPKKLFISCDGPRLGNKNEALKVKKTKEVCKEFINWDCEVKWQISDTNLGCKVGVVSAINWFFNNVQEGIILEDDNVAHPDFFLFCKNLLEKYRKDKRIWCISGSNNQNITSSLFQTCFDQDYTLQTANAFMDMSVGFFSGSDMVFSASTGVDTSGKALFPSQSLMMREKINIYRQFAQTLLGNADGRFRAPSDHAIFHFFTLAYILPNAINNPNFNGWFLLTFLLISCVMDIFFRVSVKMCEKPKHIAIGAVFGIIFGVAWYFLTKVFNEKLTYYNTVEGNDSNRRCKTSKQKFKCTYN